ncbi:MAG: phospholipase D-like domain-containing protein, partial [Myxococcota bacterium]
LRFVMSQAIPSSPQPRPSKPASSDTELRRRLEGVLGIPFTPGNRIERYVNGVEYFPAMIDAIIHARRTVEFLSYVYWTGDIADRIANVLAERAAAGVRVRVLLDGLGARPMRKDLVARMRDAGAEVEFFRPLSWRLWRNGRRTHRKVLICDGRTAFTGRAPGGVHR